MPSVPTSTRDSGEGNFAVGMPAFAMGLTAGVDPYDIEGSTASMGMGTTSTSSRGVGGDLGGDGGLGVAAGFAGPDGSDGAADGGDDDEDHGRPLLILDVDAFTSGRIFDPSSPPVAEVGSSIVEMMASDFRLRAAQLLAAKMAYHSSTGDVDGDLEAIGAALTRARKARAADEKKQSGGGDTERDAGQGNDGGAGADFVHVDAPHPLHVVEYPTSLSGVPTELLWTIVCRGTESPAADAAKALVRDASTDLMWKADMCLEIERLSVQEFAESEARAQALSRAATLRDEMTAAAGRLEAGASAELREEVRDTLGRLSAEVAELEAVAVDVDGEAPDGEQSLVEIMLDVVAERHVLPGAECRSARDDDADDDGDLMTQAEFSARLAARCGEAVEMWCDEFGRLPRASRELRRAPDSTRVPRSNENTGIFAPAGSVIDATGDPTPADASGARTSSAPVKEDRVPQNWWDDGEDM